MHRPGMVRTSEKLDEVLDTPGALHRSAYYNDWMFPQRFLHTMGSTLLAEGAVVANISLMRPPDMPPFDSADVNAFGVLSRHMTRALEVAGKLQRTGKASIGPAVLEALPQPAALLDGGRRLLHGNPRMEALLRGSRGFSLRHGLLVPTQLDAQARFARWVADIATGEAGPMPPRSLCLQSALEETIAVQLVPVIDGIGRYLPPWRAVLILVTEAGERVSVSPAALRERYAFTSSEARLASRLAEGSTMRQAAAALSISYGSARVYLKSIFQKADVHSQAQLVGRLLGTGKGDLDVARQRGK